MATIDELRDDWNAKCNAVRAALEHPVFEELTVLIREANDAHDKFRYALLFSQDDLRLADPTYPSID
jgi:hypothetical protein